MTVVADLKRPPGSDALSMLLGLGQRARQAHSVTELGFIMVNETMALVRYRQAVLWTEARGLVAVSGVSQAERNTPFAIWLNRLLRDMAPTLDGPRKLTAADPSVADAEQWPEFLPAYLLLLQLQTPLRDPTGILAFARDEPWSEAETLFLSEVAGAYGIAWAWHHRAGRWRGFFPRAAGIRYRFIALAAGLALLAACPVRLSVLAPGEVVAHDAVVVRAPIEGVIEKIYVRPNQILTKDMRLFDLDTTIVRGKLEVAQKALLTANSEYEQAAQQAFFDPKAKAQLGILAGHIGERRAEIDYYTDLMQRSEVRASRAGIAVMDDPSDWIGKPVSVGEKILAIANEQDTELEGWLSPSDMIPLKQGAKATLFSNVDPLHPVRATLRYVAYESLVRPDGTAAHRLRASLDDTTDRPRLGLKGTIRLDGENVPLIYWIFRRPLALIRQSVGL
jgi:hypothetical protein